MGAGGWGGQPPADDLGAARLPDRPLHSPLSIHDLHTTNTPATRHACTQTQAELEIFLQVVGAARLQAIGAYYARLPSATALAAWLRRQGSLAAALSHASLPASARARVAAAWEELQQLEAAAAQQQQQQQAAAAAQQQAAAAEAQQQMAGAAVAE